MTLTLNFQGQIWNLLYLSQKWSDCHKTKSKHIDRTLGLKCDHWIWPWPWPWPWIFMVKYGICYISAKNGPIATKRKANISIELKASNVTMGFDLGHDLDLEFSRSNMQFAISQSKVIRRSGVRIYKIVTGVTSDVGVPSTHLVRNCVVTVWQWGNDCLDKKHGYMFSPYVRCRICLCIRGVSLQLTWPLGNVGDCLFWRVVR